MNTKKYISLWLALTLLLFCGIGAFNYVVDPYLLYLSPTYKKINLKKPKAGTHSRQTKIHIARTMEIDTLIIGNSRPELGLDPEHAYFTRNGMKVFNLGLPGSSLAMQYGYAIDLIRDKDIRTVLIGVDFNDYTMFPSADRDPYLWLPKKSGFDGRKKYNWAGKENPFYDLNYYKDHLLPLVSLGTLKDAITTTLNQSPDASNLTIRGFNPPEHMEAITRAEGVKTLFNQKNKNIAEIFSSRKWQVFSTGHQSSPEFEKLKFFLNYLESENVKTILFINPYHAHYLEVISQAGLYPEFEKWKRAVAGLVAPEGKPLPVYSSTPNVTNTVSGAETPPQSDDTQLSLLSPPTDDASQRSVHDSDPFTDSGEISVSGVFQISIFNTEKTDKDTKLSLADLIEFWQQEIEEKPENLGNSFWLFGMDSYDDSNGFWHQKIEEKTEREGDLFWVFGMDEPSETYRLRCSSQEPVLPVYVESPFQPDPFNLDQLEEGTCLEVDVIKGSRVIETIPRSNIDTSSDVYAFDDVDLSFTLEPPRKSAPPKYIPENISAQLWDFSVMSDFITEDVITSGKTPLKWFWEPAHYRKRLGDLMIRDMLSGAPAPQFGVRLNPNMIDQHLENNRRKLRAYEEDHPDEVEYIRQFFR